VLHDPGFKSLQKQAVFSFPKRPDPLCGPPSFLFNRYRGSFPGIRRPRRGTDHLPPPPAEVKNEWSHTTTPLIRLHGVRRDSITHSVTLVPLLTSYPQANQWLAFCRVKGKSYNSCYSQYHSSFQCTCWKSNHNWMTSDDYSRLYVARSFCTCWHKIHRRWSIKYFDCYRILFFPVMANQFHTAECSPEGPSR
jgi:hypothetical protein